MSANGPDDGIPRLERELRRLAPEPDFELLAGIEELVRAPEPQPRRQPARGWQLGLAGGLTAALAAGLAATGGISYAANSLEQVVRIAHRAARPQKTIELRGLSSGGDQYRPGYGFGDPNHVHTGPPGLTLVNPQTGEPATSPAPIAPTPAPGGLARMVTAAVNFDEQVHLWISVIDPHGTPLLLTQHSKRGGSHVGGGKLGGPQTKFIQYVVLVPRTIPLQLRVPENLLRGGVTYRIRIVAISPLGVKSRILVPFRQR